LLKNTKKTLEGYFFAAPCRTKDVYLSRNNYENYSLQTVPANPHGSLTISVWNLVIWFYIQISCNATEFFYRSLQEIILYSNERYQQSCTCKPCSISLLVAAHFRPTGSNMTSDKLIHNTVHKCSD